MLCARAPFTTFSLLTALGGSTFTVLPAPSQVQGGICQVAALALWDSQAFPLASGCS